MEERVGVRVGENPGLPILKKTRGSSEFGFYKTKNEDIFVFFEDVEKRKTSSFLFEDLLLLGFFFR